MARKDSKILVLGVTGNQGGAVARSLLADGHTNVHGLVRPTSNDSKLKVLQDAGLIPVKGDLDDEASINAALQGVYGVFSVIPLDPQNLAIETARGIAVADAAKRAGVEHFIYSSVGGADRNTGIGHFETKYKIEQHILDIGLPASIVRPVALMENFTNVMRPQLDGDTATFRLALKPEKSLQFIASADIGTIVTDMFNHPDKHMDKAIEIAGDELTGPHIAATYQKVTGQPSRYVEQPIEELQAFSKDLADMFTWLNQYGYAADINALRQAYPGLSTFETWLSNNRDKVAPTSGW